MVDPTPTAPATTPSLPDLLRAFATISLSGFGGALPWARRVIVERRGWMSAEEFNEAFSLVQFLPGPNVVNFSVVFGSRFGGAIGALVAFTGLMGPPVVIVTLLAVLYASYGGVDALGRILAGISTAAVGLLIATVVKMAAPLFRRSEVWAAVIALLVFVAVGPLHWPLQWVLLVMAPLSIAIAWRRVAQ
jgi:chromate transporter